MVLIPNAVLAWRIVATVRGQDQSDLTLGQSNDNKSDIIIYVFSLLLPFYRQDFTEIRELISIAVALLVIIVIYWRLNLHYINLVCVAFGYQVFTVSPTDSRNRFSGKGHFILVTPRTFLVDGDSVTAYRVTDTVFWERKL